MSGVVIKRRAGAAGSASSAAAGVGRSLCLIVHDDLELRLQAAALLRRASPTLTADSVDRTAFVAMAGERIASYAAVILIIEFSGKAALGDPLENVARMRDLGLRIPVLVFARGGDERCAARAMKHGAADYWPIHAVKVAELREVLCPPAHPAAGVKEPAKIPPDAARRPDIAGYRLLKQIARSQGATVYLAQRAQLAQPVALKVQPLDGARAGCEADRKSFAHECQILSGLNHRSIADVIDFGITDQFLYLALEYFPCGSLRERMRNPVSEADALNYTLQIGQALQIVHAARIVHCDLKPSNVMLTNDNRIVLIDFGSARSQLVAARGTRTHVSTGTPYYVCPEQIAGRPPDARGDLYSLGVVLFEMLAGAPPFDGKTLADIFAAHRSAEVPRLPADRSRYQSVVDRLLAKEPEERYGSAEECLRALNAVTANAVKAPLSVRSI